MNFYAKLKPYMDFWNLFQYMIPCLEIVTTIGQNARFYVVNSFF